MTTPMRIGVLAYQGCMAAQVFGIVETLRIANDIAQTQGLSDPPLWQAEVVALRGGATVGGGAALRAPRPKGRFDLLVVPGLQVVQRCDWDAVLDSLQAEVRFIQTQFARGTPVATVCVGAYLAGAAGLLEGRRATTSWVFAAQLQQRHPGARIDAQAMLIEDGALTTTAAVSSASDLALHLIRRHQGVALAQATARVCLLAWQRESQAPYVDERMVVQAMPSFAEQLKKWFGPRLQEPFSLTALAQAFHISPRTLARRTLRQSGYTPLELLQGMRVAKARTYLTQTRWSLQRITEAVGYTDVTSFSRLFAREVGESPARYRRRFAQTP